MDGAEIRQEYLKARAIIANYLREKYNLIESYNDTQRLTLDSKAYSIHFIFYVPDMPEIYVSKKGTEASSNNSFMHHIFNRFPSLKEAETELKKLFSDGVETTENSFDYSAERLETTFRKKIKYFEENFTNYFD
jgi:hypothetical protein